MEDLDTFEIEVKDFSLKKTLICGQCFRFEEVEEKEFLVFSKYSSAYVRQEDSRLIFNMSDAKKNFWEDYFNLFVDYKKLLKGFEGDVILQKISSICSGIRILKQDPFETLISFILSINNNIPRIKKIIELFCRNFGEKNKNGYGFPKIEELIGHKEKDFEILKAGFRVKYILDAIRKVYYGEVLLEKIKNMSILDAKKELKKIYGVGEKVASCVLLFGYNKMDAFPIDIWIKKVLFEYYKNGPTKQLLSCPGLAQQMLFFAKRQGFI